MKEYLVILVNVKYNTIFKNFLGCHDIFYEYLNDTHTYIIKTTPSCVNLISNFNYVKSIVLDSLIPLNPEPKPIPIDNTDVPEDDNEDKNWGIYKIKANNLWNKGFTGQGVNVAIIDSGISKDSDLNIKKSLSFIDNNPSPYDNNYGHGTSMASIIVASPDNPRLTGVAYNCNLYSIKGLTIDGVEIESIIRSLEWCIDNNIQVVNMSFGIDFTNYSQLLLLENAINKASGKGIILVAATGNDNKATVVFPAQFVNVLGVGGIDMNNNRFTEAIYGSNYGYGLDFMAPGKYVVTENLKNKYTVSSGTSIASAFVAGLIALLLSEDPSRTRDDIIKILKDNALLLPTSSTNYFEYGNGLVQARD